MSNKFLRTELLIGKSGMAKLANTRVAVFGIGGVGGYVVEALVRSGIGAIDLIDDDKISITNINRQIYALQSTIGKFKVDVAAERILDINPDCNVTKHNMFFTPDISSKIDFLEFDYVVDAIDTVVGKIELVIRAQEAGVPIISSMGAGNKMHPELFEVADIYKTSVCPLAKVMRQELKKRKVKKLKVVYSKETPLKPDQNTERSGTSLDITQRGTMKTQSTKRQIPGSNAFVPSTVGLIIAGEVINDIIKVDI